MGVPRLELGPTGGRTRSKTSKLQTCPPQAANYANLIWTAPFRPIFVVFFGPFLCLGVLCPARPNCPASELDTPLGLQSLNKKTLGGVGNFCPPPPLQATHEYWASKAALEIRNHFPTSMNALCNVFSSKSSLPAPWLGGGGGVAGPGWWSHLICSCNPAYA